VIGIQIAVQSNATYSVIVPIIANHLLKMEYLVQEEQETLDALEENISVSQVANAALD